MSAATAETMFCDGECDLEDAEIGEPLWVAVTGEATYALGELDYFWFAIIWVLPDGNEISRLIICR